MSAELVCMSSVEARQITDQIRIAADATWHLIVRAYSERAWSALGYASWDDYCTREFGSSRLRLPREERADVVASLRDCGMSIRAIASATGTGTRQVQEALRDQVCSKTTPDDAAAPAADVEDEPLADGFDWGNDDPEAGEPAAPPAPEPAAEPRPIIGTDGKNYPAAPAASKEHRRKPITDAFDTATYDLKRNVERVIRLVADDRFSKNKDQISGANLSDLVRVRDAINGVIQQIEG